MPMPPELGPYTQEDLADGALQAAFERQNGPSTVEERADGFYLVAAQGSEKAAEKFELKKLPDGSMAAFDSTTGKLLPGSEIPASKVTPQSNWDIRVNPATGGLIILNLADRFPLITQFEIPGTAPTEFKLGEIEKRDGLNFIQRSKGQFELLPARFQPGVVEQSGRFFIQQPDGQLQLLPREYEAGLRNIGSRSFLQQPDGSLSPLPGKADVVTRAGREFIQQPSGNLSELAPRTPDAVMDSIISEAIVNGDIDKALAFQDFRDRPTDQEALAYAFQFARSPADQLVVSALARGDQVVEQRPSTPTRIGPQPDFLINAFNKFQKRLSAGRAPTGEEAQFYLDFPRKREEQRLEQERLRTEAMDASTQSALEKAVRDAIATARDYGQYLGGRNPSLQQRGNVASGDLATQGFSIPWLSAASQSLMSRQTQGGVPAGNLTPSQIDFINQFSAGAQPMAQGGIKTGRDYGQSSAANAPFDASARDASNARIMAAANAPLGTYPGDQPASWFKGDIPQSFQSGGIVFGPTNAILGESGPEAVIPLTNEENLPIDVRMLQKGRPIPPSRGNLFRAAGLTIPSAQALQNLTPESLASFRDLGALAGIPPQSFEQELRLGSPAGRRTRSPLFLPFLFRSQT